MEYIVKIRVMDSMALRMIVKYERKATMLPEPVCPALTRRAPTHTSSTSPIFSRSCIVGPLTAMTEAARVSLAATSPLMASKRRFSSLVLESALIMRMPVISSRTTRTSLSTFFCSLSYSGTPLPEMNHTTSAIKGKIATSRAESAGSSVMVMIMPPTSKMGARIPMR